MVPSLLATGGAVAALCAAIGWMGVFDALAAALVLWLAFHFDVQWSPGPDAEGALAREQAPTEGAGSPMDRAGLKQTMMAVAEGESPLTLYQFLQSCKLVRYDHLESLFWSKDVAKKVLDPEFRQVRRTMLRGMAKKLTHPLFGITCTGSDKFRGTEIVDWLCTNFDMRSRARGVEFGRLLHAAGILKPLRRNKTEINGPRKNVRFSDKMRHWRFAMEAIDRSWPAERELLARKMTSPAQMLSVSPRELVSAAARGSGDDAVGADMAPNSQMTERDWQYLFQAAGRVDTFPDNHTIVEYGQPSECLYRVVHGQARVTGVPTSEQVTRILAYLVEGSVFGEETACGLGDDVVSMQAVCADGGPITVQSVDSATLSKLLRIEPLIARSFWKWLAASLATRLRRFIRVEEGEPQLDASSRSLLAGHRRPSRSSPVPGDGGGGDASAALPSPAESLIPGKGSPTLAARSGMKIAAAISMAKAAAKNSRRSVDSPLINSEEWNRPFGTPATSSTPLTATTEDGSILIKQFAVNWLGLKNAQFFITQQGIGLLSRFYKRKLAIPYASMDALERNDAKAQLIIRSTVNVAILGLSKKRETSLVFTDPQDLSKAVDLIEHVRSAASSGAVATTAEAPARELFVEHDLTADDWQRLMEGARQAVFPAGQSIVVSRAVVQQIVSGTVRMVARSGRQLGTLVEGDFVGDAELVLSSAMGEVTYVCETPVETVGFVMEVLRVLFVNHPDLCARFYRFLCVSLAVRLRGLANAQ